MSNKNYDEIKVISSKPLVASILSYMFAMSSTISISV